MHTIQIIDDQTGAPRFIANPLEPELIRNGVFIWYDGGSGAAAWDCPGMIVEVIPRKEFRVLSFDTMNIRTSWYDFVLDTRAHGSRKTMRIATPDEVRAYIDNQRTGLVECLLQASRQVQKRSEELEHFDQVYRTLKL